MDGIRAFPMVKDHWDQVARIYQQGIDFTDATFDEHPPTWEEFDSVRLPGHRWVITDSSSTLLGWASLSGSLEKAAYRGVAEVSVYVDQDQRGRGLGRFLLSHLIEMSERDGIWTLGALIFPENTASIRLHKDFGFVEVGVRRRLGKMTYGPLRGQWRDVVLLDRRSAVAGID